MTSTQGIQPATLGMCIHNCGAGPQRSTGKTTSIAWEPTISTIGNGVTRRFSVTNGYLKMPVPDSKEVALGWHSVAQAVEESLAAHVFNEFGRCYCDALITLSVILLFMFIVK